MRLAVIESAPRGGLLHYAAQLAEALAARGHEVDLITARGHDLGAALPGVEVRGVLPVAAVEATEPPTGVRALIRRAGIATRVVAASLRTAREVTRGRYDAAVLVDDLSVAPAAAGALLMTLIPGRPRLAAICHEPKPRSRRGGDLYARSFVLLGLLRRVYPRLDVVFVHGEESRRQFEASWPPARVRVIPHGDSRIFGDAPPPPADAERVLFFGEWRRAKGLPELMAAFDRLALERPNARLVIAGLPTPDAEPDRVRAWAGAHDGRVTLVDRFVPDGEVRQLFADARVVAAPYVAGSQSGVVHLAMTMARAVVASDVGELPRAVVDGVTGRIVPAGDIESLASALGEVLADPELARQLGEAGRERVLSEFGWERVAAEVEPALR